MTSDTLTATIAGLAEQIGRLRKAAARFRGAAEDPAMPDPADILSMFLMGWYRLNEAADALEALTNRGADKEAEPFGGSIDYTMDQMAKLAFVVFYSSNLCAPQNLKSVIDEIDTCGGGCEHVSGSTCYKQERGDYCPWSLAEDLRNISLALYGPTDPSGYRASVWGPTVQPAPPTSTAEPVRVRELEWGTPYVEPAYKYTSIDARSLVGYYNVSQFEGGMAVLDHVSSRLGTFDTISLAQAAAQEHYSNAICSALEQED